MNNTNNTIRIKLNSIDDAREFSRICEKFENDIDYVIGRYVIDAKSLLGILSTSLGKIAQVTIHRIDQKAVEQFLNAIYKWMVDINI